MVHRHVNASEESGELLLYPKQGQGNLNPQHYSATTIKRDDALALEQKALEGQTPKWADREPKQIKNRGPGDNYTLFIIEIN